MSAKSTMSPDLIAFLKAWYHWATNGAPHREPFRRNDGLCDNVWKWGDGSKAQKYEVHDALADMFGGRWFPFGEENYDARYEASTQHECPKRLAWVRERLFEAGELRNCNDCDFSTTEKDVTVCPDRACRGSVA